MKLAVTMLLAVMGGAAFAHEGHKEPAPAQKEPLAPIAVPKEAKGGTRDARAYFTDTVLVTQDGQKVRFYTDVMEGKTVLINVVYTNCKDACPLITQKLIETRAKMGERFAKDVYFITLTSDPERDSPAAMKAFAQKQSADLPGWAWLTGSKQDIDFILKRLGQFSKHVEEHSTLLIAGNVPNKRWTKIRPDAPPEAIAERLKLLASPGMLMPGVGG